MKILPKDAKKYYFELDILRIGMLGVIVVLTIAGIFPMWVLLFVVLNSTKGVIVKIG